jgi:hemerythrin-like domain-containing protein
MNTRLPGHEAPAAGFEAPLDMLTACHQRIERQCATLLRLAAHLPEHGADAQAQQAAAAVQRYFDVAARHHHADEEDDLFPALLEAMAGSDAVCLRELNDTLTREHRELEDSWAVVRTSLADIAAGTSAHLDGAAVRSLVERYRAHIAREDAELLPMAARLLDDAALQQIGRAMRERRGIADSDLPRE